MYGTVAHIHMKPGMQDEMSTYMKEYESITIPGSIGEFVYRMDSDPNECYLVVLFDSKQSYDANASSPEQDARYRKLLDLLVSEPEWHDGEIVYSQMTSGIPTIR